MKMEVFACKITDLEGDRKRLKIDNHDVIILRHKGIFYALDSFCYHAGGPLYKGDIEDIGSHSCIVCPWHRYKVTLQTGENFYQSIDPYNTKKAPVWTCGGVKQRTHQVIIKDEDFYLKLSPCSGDLDSDHYNSPEYKYKNDLT
ncbi:Rieske domain-containing protein-like isoform X2 [Mytilus edulis]|uniref:Rieske domain-containing protein-like isoform X2 n=1 Tax=Mytilus edulis TaxID=6550 RepID=UPI0039F139D6